MRPPRDPEAFQQSPRGPRRGERASGSASRCSRSFATSIQATAPSPPPAAAAVCHASTASDQRPSRRSVLARSAASRSSVQRPVLSSQAPTRVTAPAVRHGRWRARHASRPPVRALRRLAGPAASTTARAPRLPPRARAAARPRCARTGPAPAAPRRARRPGTRAPPRAGGPSRRLGQAREIPAGGLVTGRPVHVPVLDVGKQQPERADVLLVVDHDPGQGADRTAPQDLEVDGRDLPALDVTDRAKPPAAPSRRSGAWRSPSGGGTRAGRRAAGPGVRHGPVPRPARRYRASISGQSNPRPL